MNDGEFSQMMTDNTDIHVKAEGQKDKASGVSLYEGYQSEWSAHRLSLGTSAINVCKNISDITVLSLLP